MGSSLMGLPSSGSSSGSVMFGLSLTIQGGSHPLPAGNVYMYIYIFFLKVINYTTVYLAIFNAGIHIICHKLIM